MTMTDEYFSDELSAEERRELPASDFGIPGTREFPLHDAAHVRAAESYFRFAPEEYKPLLAYRILLKARQFDVDVKSPVILSWAKKYEK